MADTAQTDEMNANLFGRVFDAERLRRWSKANYMEKNHFVILLAC